MMSITGQQNRDIAAEVPEVFIEETAEAAYLSYSGEEEEANDNFPAHEILQGCIWRDTETAQQRLGLTEEVAAIDGREDAADRRELDFSDGHRGARGFLDEETGPDMIFPDY